MEIARLVLEYVKVLIWPIVVILVVLMFRSQLRAMLWRLRKAELPMGVSLDFQEELQEERAYQSRLKRLPKMKHNDPIYQ